MVVGSSVYVHTLTHSYIQVPKLPDLAQNVNFIIGYKTEPQLYFYTATYIPSLEVEEGDTVNYTLRSLSRNTAYNIRIQASIQYSACSSYTSGNNSDTITLQTNDTCNMQFSLSFS